MRTLLAIVIFLGGILALNSSADAARKYKRAKAYYYYAVPSRPFRGSGCGACGYDITGEFKGFPGWARKAFSEGRRGD
jgi:hypothetical protein